MSLPLSLSIIHMDEDCSLRFACDADGKWSKSFEQTSLKNHIFVRRERFALQKCLQVNKAKINGLHQNFRL